MVADPCNSADRETGWSGGLFTPGFISRKDVEDLLGTHWNETIKQGAIRCNGVADGP